MSTITEEKKDTITAVITYDSKEYNSISEFRDEIRKASPLDIHSGARWHFLDEDGNNIINVPVSIQPSYMTLSRWLMEIESFMEAYAEVIEHGDYCKTPERYVQACCYAEMTIPTNHWIDGTWTSDRVNYAQDLYMENRDVSYELASYLDWAGVFDDLVCMEAEVYEADDGWVIYW